MGQWGSGGCCPPRELFSRASLARGSGPGELVIAKLDRLSRNLAFIATLMESGVEFVAVDNPHANKLTVHILAAVAQHEREMISERTKAALKAARARGRRSADGKTRHGGAKGKREAVCGQRAADHPRYREGRRREPQCHRRKAQRAQRSHGARRQVDACTGRGGASPFRGRRRKRRHVAGGASAPYRRAIKSGRRGAGPAGPLHPFTVGMLALRRPLSRR